MRPDTKHIEEKALVTLFSIQRYVSPHLFTIDGLAKGLGRNLDDIETDVRWLSQNGFVAQLPKSKKMYITQKGKRLEEPKSSNSEGFDSDFLSAKKPETRKDEDKDGPEEDGADSFCGPIENRTRDCAMRMHRYATYL